MELFQETMKRPNYAEHLDAYLPKSMMHSVAVVLLTTVSFREVTPRILLDA